MNPKRLCLALVALAILPLFGAASFPLEVIPQNITIIQDSLQHASYLLLLSNPYPYEDTLEIRFRDVGWSVWSDPLSDTVGGGVTLPPNGTYTVKLFARPSDRKPIGLYSIPFSVRSRVRGEVYSSGLYVDIISGTPPFREYAIALVASAELPKRMDPRNTYELLVSVQNTFPRNISNIELTLDSELIKARRVFDIKPLSKEELRFTLNFHPTQPPLTDTLKITLTVGEQLIESIRTDYSIIAYSDVEKIRDETKKGFLRSSRQITFFNDGNIEVTHRYTLPKGFLAGLFTRTSPAHATLRNDYGRFMVWDLKLPPQGSASIEIRKNYMPLFWLFVALIVLLLLYRIFRSPLIIEKHGRVQEVKEGTISEVKVMLSIKNRSRRALSAIVLVDKVPAIATMQRDFPVGMLQPDKIARDSRGNTLVKWVIPTLEPYEERLISYSIKLRLNVLGSFSLPKAIAQFKTSAGMRLTARSGLGKILA